MTHYLALFALGLCVAWSALGLAWWFHNSLVRREIRRRLRLDP